MFEVGDSPDRQWAEDILSLSYWKESCRLLFEERPGLCGVRNGFIIVNISSPKFGELL